MDIPFEYREAVNTYQEVVMDGIRLYPIKVREFEDFHLARPAITFLQQTLPVRYLSTPLLSAFYAMDFERQRDGEEPNGHFVRALLFIAMALRIYEGEAAGDRVRLMTNHILVSKEDPSVLKGIVVKQDGIEKKITPALFQRMRPILAAQNGIELVSDDANPELLEAERDLVDARGPKLDYDPQTLISSIAAFSRTDEKDIYNWPLLKLTRWHQAYERLFGYLVFGFATATGTSFKGGNPVPSAFFERSEKETGVLLDINSVTGGAQISVAEPQTI